MSGFVITVENRRINSRSIVTNPEPQVLLIISDFNLDSTGIGMPDRIAYRLRSNPVCFVTNDGIKKGLFSFDLHMNFGNCFRDCAAQEALLQNCLLPGPDQSQLIPQSAAHVQRLCHP